MGIAGCSGVFLGVGDGVASGVGTGGVVDFFVLRPDCAKAVSTHNTRQLRVTIATRRDLVRSALHSMDDEYYLKSHELCIRADQNEKFAGQGCLPRLRLKPKPLSRFVQAVQQTGSLFDGHKFYAATNLLTTVPDS